jgi:secreted trypsin-like serine protease
MKPMTKKVAVTASVFVFFLAVCIGIGIRSSNKTKPTATSSALALEGTDSVFPEVINGETLDFDVWDQTRRYLVDIRRNGGHSCGATLISRRVVLTAAREFEKFK